MENNNAKNKFIYIVVIVLSVIIVIFLVNKLLDSSDDINQGKFRVSDLVVLSAIEIEDEFMENTDVTTLSNLKLNITQKNVISFMIAKSEGIEANKIYIDNVNITFPNMSESMYIYQDEKKINLNEENIKLDILKIEKDEQYVFEIGINNVNFIKDAVVPDTKDSIVFDGTILKLLNVNISDIMFNISFDLNIIDSNGRNNVSKLNFNLPNKILETSGISIIREEVGNFPFKLK